MRESTAVRKITEHGILLVFPVPNRADPASLWSVAYPGEAMRWDWSEDADPRVVELWHLRERLSHHREVVYAKWFRGRATFFARDVFTALLGRLAGGLDPLDGLPREAQQLLELLEDESPQSTKVVRAALELQGRRNEALFQQALKALWTRLLVVGAGEVDDGAFPSLAIGATSLMREELWRARLDVPAEATQRLEAVLAASPSLARELARAERSPRRAGRP